MVTIPANTAPSRHHLTLVEAIKDIAIIVVLSIGVIGLVVVLHAILPPIG
jgi:hypothetical protein